MMIKYFVTGDMDNCIDAYYWIRIHLAYKGRYNDKT